MRPRAELLQFGAVLPEKTCPEEAPKLTRGIHMSTTILAAVSNTAFSMCSAGILFFFVALWAAKPDFTRAGGLDKIVTLSNLCFAVLLAVFGALHLAGVEFVISLVPSCIDLHSFHW